MKILGITGNSGGGKSSVSSILSSKHAYVIDADKLNHEIMEVGKKAYFDIILAFSKNVLNEDSTINRRLLAEIVFYDKDKLSILVNITHKYVIEETHKKIDKINKSPGSYKYIVIDAPLLIEAGLNKLCDEVWLITADEHIRLKRIMERDSLKEEQVKSRFNNQSSVDDLMPYADAIINNNFKGKRKLEDCVNILLNNFLEL